jgi:prepilin-type N-terminal cleavage/methylation domain-containing protein
MHSRPLAINQGRGRSGFTLPELLVVVGVIGVLMAIAIPALRGALDSGRQTNEMAAARHLMLAWSSYAADQRDALMPGYLHGLRALDAEGNELTGEPAARYPWRIAPYLDYDVHGLYKNAHVQDLEALGNDPLLTYFVSLNPSLGINGQWVGGDEQGSSFNATAIRAYGHFCVTSLAAVKRTGRLLVFASARGADPQDADSQVVEGYFKVLSPIFRAASGSRWSQTFDDHDPPAAYGFVSPRYSDAAVVALTDGHVDVFDENELRDMRHWANLATSPDYGVKVTP